MATGCFYSLNRMAPGDGASSTGSKGGRLLSFGTYPEVPLKTARERREQARCLIATGVDPSAERKAKIATREDTFQALALEWLQMQQKSLSARTFKKKKDRFEAFAFPYLGKTPIAELKAPDVLAVHLKPLE